MSDELIPLKIAPNILADIYREARNAFPFECCGWLSGPKDGDEVTVVRACENAQASGTHPTEAQRGAERAYVITGDDLLSLYRTLESEMPARIIFHSHPKWKRWRWPTFTSWFPILRRLRSTSSGAYLSSTDRKVATSPWEDGPAYPVQQLVVGIDSKRVVESALFAWSDDEGGFVQIARLDGADV